MMVGNAETCEHTFFALDVKVGENIWEVQFIFHADTRAEMLPETELNESDVRFLNRIIP